ncbi:hypothetical protein [Gilvimarinus xylanilyticus]|uniref:Uncharacterized protein n=1 Tax=Gilvimarinus xylanilyticus TaxID=2944139 RepID=A0A9X2HTU6_9GAMM|nr:hypothetical protein [Gilvimarinus xylanilyticus]MCP8898135.1 hypothetical protein [Gilvimarinus xylanilyticus]
MHRINLAIKQIVLINFIVALKILAQVRGLAGISTARDRLNAGGGASMHRINLAIK